MKKIIIGALLALTLCGMGIPAYADDYDCENYSRAITIENSTSFEITQVYAANRDYTTDWSENLLEFTISPGESDEVSVDDGTGYHIFHVEVETDEGYMATITLNACDYSGSYWNIFDDQLEAGDY